MTTSKYGLHEIEYSTQGWDTIMNTDMSQLDDVIHTNLLITLGETVDQYKAVGMFKAETKYKLAQANGRLVPALGITLESGVDEDEIRVQRVGPITNVSWTWIPGRPVFLSPSIAGDLTQSPDGSNQLLGMATSATTLLLSGSYDFGALATTTTTTTSTTSTTSSTTTTTTTTV